jgi:hypothetical protein
VIALVAAASAASVGWSTGFDARLGKGAAYVGVGGGPTVRFDLSEHVDLHGEARLLVLAGTVGVFRAGVGVSTKKDHWNPGLGLDVALFAGPSLRAVTAENPALAAPVAPALQLRLDPLRFGVDSFSAEVLRIEVGGGYERGALAPAFGVTFAEVAVRW